MYKIGEFSLLNKVTIKTLRYYDEIGLFKPKMVDNFTGYRYYDDSQQEEFDRIIHYKELGFSLEDIMQLKNDLDESIIKNKLEELNKEKEDNEKRIEVLRNMMGGDSMINIEYKFYDEKYKIGKRVTLKNRNDFEKELASVALELDNLKIQKGRSVLCNFELGYEKENIDAFVGYEVDEFEIPSELEAKSELEVMSLSKIDKFLVGTCKEKDIDNIYSKMVKYANENKIQIRGWFTEIYENNNIELYVEAFDLEEVNSDYMYMLGKFNARNAEMNETDERLIGTYKIREILPSIKYMFNESKQKSILDTKYEILELNKDGTTNYKNITWNNKNLQIEYDGMIIPVPIYVTNINDKYYLELLMNETLEYYKSQRPMQYLYEKIK